MSAINDLTALVLANWVFGNITYEHGGTAAKATIMTEAAFDRNTPNPKNINGRVLFAKQQRGTPIPTSAELWNIPYIIDGSIEYENANNFNDTVISEMFTELERVLKVNNNNQPRTFVAIITEEIPDHNTSEPLTKFVVDLTELDVSRV